MKNILLCMAVAVFCAGCENMTTQPAAGQSVIAFSASWCSGCVAAKPEIVRLQAAGVQIRVVDCASMAGDAEAERYNITKLPTFILIVGGREAGRTHDVYTVRKWFGG